MYRYLWSNGPKECLEFADYSFDEHFGKPIPSFPPREVLQDYILGRVSKGNIKSKIKFNTRVTNTVFKNDKFEISYQDKVNTKIFKSVNSSWDCGMSSTNNVKLISLRCCIFDSNTFSSKCFNTVPVYADLDILKFSNIFEH